MGTEKDKRNVNWLLAAPSQDNLADQLSQEELDKLGTLVCRMYDLDRENRKEWDDRSASAMKLAKLIREEKNSPWVGAANIKHPLITSATIQFAARAYPEICKSGKVEIGRAHV